MKAAFFDGGAACGFCPVGGVFDADDPVHQKMDAARYACWIQEARDCGDYARADEVRTMVLGFGAIIRSTKSGTYVIEGLRYDNPLAPKIPCWGGGTSWVNPEGAAGREVIETCYYHASSRVHSVCVMNWGNHPNFDTAKQLGLPTSLWSKDGQRTLATAKSTDWFFQQIRAIEAAAMNIAADRIMQMV